MDVVHGELIILDSINELNELHNSEDSGMYIILPIPQVKDMNELNRLGINIHTDDYSYNGNIPEFFDYIYEVVCTSTLCKQIKYNFNESNNQEYIMERYYIDNQWTNWFNRSMKNIKTDYDKGFGHYDIEEEQVTTMITHRKLASSYDSSRIMAELNKYANNGDLNNRLRYDRNERNPNNEITFNGAVRVNHVIRFENHNIASMGAMGITFNNEPRILSISTVRQTGTSPTGIAFLTNMVIHQSTIIILVILHL